MRLRISRCALRAKRRRGTPTRPATRRRSRISARAFLRTSPSYRCCRASRLRYCARRRTARLPPAVAEAGQDIQRLALGDADPLVAAVGEVEIFLLRVLRERDVPHRAAPARARRHEQLADERAVLAEHVEPVVDAIADIDEAVRGRLGGLEPRRDARVGRRAFGATAPRERAGQTKKKNAIRRVIAPPPPSRADCRTGKP